MARNLRRMRRATAAGVVAGGLWLGGCYGVTPIGAAPPIDADAPVDTDVIENVDTDLGDASGDSDLDPNPTVCESEYRLSGDVAPTQYFVCSWDDPIEPLAAPIFIGNGQLCEGAVALGVFRLPEPTRIRIGLLDSSQVVRLMVVTPEGSIISEIGPGDSCLELDVGTDLVRLAAESAVSPHPDNGFFEFHIDLVDE